MIVNGQIRRSPLTVSRAHVPPAGSHTKYLPLLHDFFSLVSSRGRGRGGSLRRGSMVLVNDLAQFRDLLLFHFRILLMFRAYALQNL